jgi:hypothetical protein
LAACIPYCTVPTSADQGSAGKALTECLSAADIGSCSTYGQEARTCTKNLGMSPAAFCLDAPANPVHLLEYFLLACGPAPVDGGPPPPDASLPDTGIPPDTGP